MREDIPNELIQLVNDSGCSAENLELIPPAVLALLISFGRSQERAEILSWLEAESKLHAD